MELPVISALIGSPTISTKIERAMNLFKRIAAALSGATPQDDMANCYPAAALDETHEFQVYPPKILLKDQGVFAYRLEFATFKADASRVLGALASQFECPDQALFQEGRVQNGGKSVHFSIRQEFGGAVIVLVTNSIELIKKIDALDIEPPPPWVAFPDIDPSILGSLQGAMEYWWDWLFSPFWSGLSANERMDYLTRHSADEDWADFLSMRERIVTE